MTARFTIVTGKQLGPYGTQRTGDGWGTTPVPASKPIFKPIWQSALETWQQASREERLEEGRYVPVRPPPPPPYVPARLPPPPPVVAKPVAPPQPQLKYWWKPTYGEKKLLPWHKPKCVSTILRTIEVDDCEWIERPIKSSYKEPTHKRMPTRLTPIVEWNDDLDLGCEDVECWQLH